MCRLNSYSFSDAEFSQATMLGFGLGIPFAFVLILLAVACKPSRWTCRHFRDIICTRLGCVQPPGMEIYKRRHQETASIEGIEELE